MKKIIILFLSVVSIFSMFAQQFDLQKFTALKKSNKEELYKYCAQAQPNQIGIANKQYFFAIKYLIGKQEQKFTKEQVLQIVTPFINAAKKQSTKDIIKFIGFESANLYDDSNFMAEEIYKRYSVKIPFGMIATRYINQKKYDKALQIANKYQLIPIQLKLAKINQDYILLWNASEKILCSQSGVKNADKATKILREMFRYKPHTITKEQQIYLIQKLSKIYPVSGTDFNKWKPFVSFISYKYKLLTGKQLK